MLVAELITPDSVPDWKKRGFIQGEQICCEDCNLSYNNEHHEILRDNKKVAYFFFADSIDPSKMYLLCHGCLFKHIKILADGEEAELLILDDNNEYQCKFYPEDMAGYDEIDLGSSDDDLLDWLPED